MLQSIKGNKAVNVCCSSGLLFVAVSTDIHSLHALPQVCMYYIYMCVFKRKSLFAIQIIFWLATQKPGETTTKLPISALLRDTS